MEVATHEEIAEMYGMSIIVDELMDLDELTPEAELEELEHSAESWLAEQNYINYYTRRGRTCEYPGCEAKIRYTREVPVCGLHELTDFAQRHPAAPRERGRPQTPRLFGLRKVLESSYVGTRELAEKTGRSQKWIQRVVSTELGVSDEFRAVMAQILDVSEAMLLDGREA